jgi:uncharacterized protein
MNNISKNAFEGGRTLPWYYLFILIIFVFIGLFLGQGIGLAISILFTNLTLDRVSEIVTGPYTEDKRIPIYLLQGFGTIGGFIVSGIIYLKSFERIRPRSLFRNIPRPGIILISAVMVFSFMLANSYLIDWNAGIHFPGSLKDFESWARGKEDELKVITDFITRFNSPVDFMIGFLIVAVIPALGEEFLFRGIIQNKLETIAKNGHIAIWFTAVLFSAFHFQFFGFIPRMMLGVLFGYMYYWSRNLWFPIIAHFINNGFTVTMIYLYNEGYITINIGDDKALSLSTTLIFAIVGIIFLFYYRSYFLNQPEVSNG